MPRVDAYLGDRVPTAPRRPTRYRAQDTDGSLAVAQGLDQVGRAVQAIQQDQRQQALKTAATTANRQFDQLYLIQGLSPDRGQTATGDPGNKGILTMQGRVPHDQLDENLKAYDEQAQMIVGAAKTPEQRLALEEIYQARRAQYVEQVQKHAYVEFGKYRSGEAISALQSTQDTMIAAAGTTGGDAVIASSLAQAERLIYANADVLGLDGPKAIQQKFDEFRSQSHVAVVQKYLAAGNAIQAKAYFTEKMGDEKAGRPREILEIDAARVRDKVEANATDTAANMDADAEWVAHGPKQYGDDVDMFTMEENLLARAGGDVTRRNAARQYLRSKAVSWEAQGKQRQDRSRWAIYNAIEQGATLDQIKAMPQWSQNEPIWGKVIAELRQKQRADYSFNRSLLNDPYEDYVRAERTREISYSERFNTILDNPGALVTKGDEFLVDVREHGSTDQYNTVRRLLKEVQGNKAAADRVDIDNARLKAAMVRGGATWANQEPSTYSPAQQVQLADMRREVNTRIQSVLRAGVEATGRVPTLTPGEEEKLIDEVVLEKWTTRGALGGVFGPGTATRAQVTRDRLGLDIVKIEDMRPDGRDLLVRMLQEKTATNDMALLPKTIMARYRGAMERAYAAFELGAPQAEWEKILFSTLSNPAAARPRATNPAGPPPRGTPPPPDITRPQR